MSDQEISYVSANDLQFAYLEQGEGPLVLLLHGFPDTAYTWSRVLPALSSKGYRAVAPFMRGYAPSERPRQDPDMRTLGEDVLGLINALEPSSEPVIVVGHDWGASAAYAAACLDPTRIRKLVSVAIPFPPGLPISLRTLWSVRHIFTLRLPGAERRFAAGDLAGIDALVRRWSPLWKFGPEDLAPVKRCFQAPGSLRAALGYYRANGLPPPALRGPIRVPTLAIAGDSDSMFRARHFGLVAGHFTAPYCIARMPGGHFLHREDPEQFNDLLLAYLEWPGLT
ncbi:MAG: alpha/beta hydrolase [Enhygromyxa sp.]